MLSYCCCSSILCHVFSPSASHLWWAPLHLVDFMMLILTTEFVPNKSFEKINSIIEWLQWSSVPIISRKYVELVVCCQVMLFDGGCHLPPAHLPLFIRQQSRPVHFPDHQSTFLGRCWTIENSLNNKEKKSIYLFPGWINTFCQHMARLGCEQDKWVLQKVPIKEWMKHDWSMNS